MRTLVIFSDEKREVYVEVGAKYHRTEKRANEWVAATKVDGADAWEAAMNFIDFLRHKQWRIATEAEPSVGVDQTIMVRCRAGQGFLVAIQNKEA